MVSFYVNSFVHHDCSPDYFLFPFPFHLMHSFFFRKMQISSPVCWADSLKDVKEKIFAFDCSTFFKNLYWTFQPTHAIIIKAWVMPVERAVTKHPSTKRCVTTNSLRNGIALWELQELKCQQHVCQHSDVVQTGQAGWMVFILQWKMVKWTGRSALVIVILIVKP